MFKILQEKENAILEAAHLAGHQNHHQKIHYMEKLKQQNIELTEVCTKTDMLMVLEQRVDAEKGPRKLRDKIKYFEMLEGHRKNDIHSQIDSRRSGEKRCSLGSLELHQKEDKRAFLRQMKARRSVDDLPLSRSKDNSFLAKDIFSRDLSATEPDNTAYLREAMDVHMTGMSPLEFLVSTMNAPQHLVTPKSHDTTDDAESVTFSQNVTPSASVASLAKEATKAAGIINAKISEMTYQDPQEMQTPEQNVKLHDLADNSSPFIVVQENVSGIVVDKKKAIFEEQHDVNNLYTAVDELRELEPAKNDVEDSHGYLWETEGKDYVIRQDVNLNTGAQVEHLSPESSFGLSTTDCSIGLYDATDDEGLTVDCEDSSLFDSKRSTSFKIFDAPPLIYSPALVRGTVNKIRAKFQNLQ